MSSENHVPIIELKQVSFSYGKEKVLEMVDMTLERGEFLGLVGPNGAGKSTLIKIILGLLKPDEGEVRLFGQPMASFQDWSKIGYVSQKANSFNSGFPATVFEVVSMGLFGKMGLFKWMGRKEKERVKEAIHMVGLSDYAKKNIGMLSGGQQQRVFIARALVSDPELLILDEPTVGVDEPSVNQFYQLLQNMHQKMGLSLLLISHDIGVISSKVDTIACLNRTLYFHGGPEEFLEEQQQILDKTYDHDVRVIQHNH
ncbi:metal ABC transporter ATP-binding protein [Microaerobacter geothermalis]|uniref:metal ABC transporter ATP-binding protein n=1 Tax=Microaerobacter geothermalis TaxID=674972 RepID=UPI001F3E2FB6|nr:metal ABC transporter ATP-binding protein [Microaerobacter geothermalis]